MAMEILIPNSAIRNLIREDKIHQIYSAMQTGQEKIRHADLQSVALHALSAQTDYLETALDRSSNKDELQDMVNRAVPAGQARGPAPAVPARRWQEAEGKPLEGVSNRN